ncbi:MAG TPA: hypothetical protein VNJ09_00775 [Chthonomonadales bacterium]|nr:hypothetical protein [Chthonomonadales bacterium]
MSGIQTTNLEIQCAELGRKLAGISGMEEKILNAALTVLEEQGPYAMFLYLQARHSNVADAISEESLSFLKEVFANQLDGVNNILDAVKRLADNLDDFLFTRDLLRTALSYARYHLKAKGGGGS